MQVGMDVKLDIDNLGGEIHDYMVNGIKESDWVLLVSWREDTPSSRPSLLKKKKPTKKTA